MQQIIEAKCRSNTQCTSIYTTQLLILGARVFLKLDNQRFRALMGPSSGKWTQQQKKECEWWKQNSGMWTEMMVWRYHICGSLYSLLRLSSINQHPCFLILFPSFTFLSSVSITHILFSYSVVEFISLKKEPVRAPKRWLSSFKNTLAPRISNRVVYYVQRTK